MGGGLKGTGAVVKEGVYLYVKRLQPWPRPPVPLQTVLTTINPLKKQNLPSVNSYNRKSLARNPLVE